MPPNEPKTRPLTDSEWNAAARNWLQLCYALGLPLQTDPAEILARIPDRPAPTDVRVQT